MRRRQNPRQLRNVATIERFQFLFACHLERSHVAAQTPVRNVNQSELSKETHFKGDPLSAFSLFVIGFIVLLTGLAYGAYLLHVPVVWIGVGSLVLIGLGVMSAVSHTKQRDEPKETHEA